MALKRDEYERQQRQKKAAFLAKRRADPVYSQLQKQLTLLLIEVEVILQEYCSIHPEELQLIFGGIAITNGFNLMSRKIKSKTEGTRKQLIPELVFMLKLLDAAPEDADLAELKSALADSLRIQQGELQLTETEMQRLFNEWVEEQKRFEERDRSRT